MSSCSITNDEITNLNLSVIDMKYSYISLIAVILFILGGCNSLFVYFVLVDNNKVKQKRDDSNDKVSKKWAIVQSIISGYSIVFILILMILVFKTTRITNCILFVYKKIKDGVTSFFKKIIDSIFKRFKRNDKTKGWGSENYENTEVPSRWDHYKIINEVIYEFDILSSFKPFNHIKNSKYYFGAILASFIVLVILTLIPTAVSFNITTGDFLSFWVYVYMVLGINLIIFMLFFFPIILYILDKNENFTVILDKLIANNDIANVITNCINKRTDSMKGGSKRRKR